MGMFRRNYIGSSWTVYDERDGMLGWIKPAEHGPGWDWSTDLKGLRMEQQFCGTAGTLEDAQRAFKLEYQRWRAGFTDSQFDSVFRRSGPETKKTRSARS